MQWRSLRTISPPEGSDWHTIANSFTRSLILILSHHESATGRMGQETHACYHTVITEHKQNYWDANNQRSHWLFACFSSLSPGALGVTPNLYTSEVQSQHKAYLEHAGGDELAELGDSSKAIDNTLLITEMGNWGPQQRRDLYKSHGPLMLNSDLILLLTFFPILNVVRSTLSLWKTENGLWSQKWILYNQPKKNRTF